MNKPKFGNRDQISSRANTQRLQDQEIKISIICAGQIFGNEDVLNARNYTTTVRCLSNVAQIYCIKAEEFTHRMSRDDKTWDMLTKMTSSKDDTTVGKIKKNLKTTKQRNKSYLRENLLQSQQHTRNSISFTGQTINPENRNSLNMTTTQSRNPAI